MAGSVKGLAYNSAVLITAVKKFIIQDLEVAEKLQLFKELKFS
jgi:hypothetical protein